MCNRFVEETSMLCGSRAGLTISFLILTVLILEFGLRRRDAADWLVRARLTLTLLHELRRSGKRYGLGSACIGGGQGIALVVEAYHQ